MNLLILLRTSRTAQIVMLALVLVAAFFIWLAFHDRGVIKRENEALNEAAQEQGAKARDLADDQQELRNETFVISKEGLGNASGPVDYLERLRAIQDRERAKAAGR